MKKKTIQLYLVIIFFFFLKNNICRAQSVVSPLQANDSLNKINRKYGKEVDVDMQGLFLKTPGTAIIFKTRYGRNHHPELNAATNLRFQVGVNGSVPANETNTAQDTIRNRVAIKTASSYSLQLMIGEERVIFFGKFNLYHGTDIGPYYSFASSGYTFVSVAGFGSSTSTGAGGLYLTQNTTTRYGISITPFFGVKYRFAEHFSAGIESGFYGAYSWVQTNTTSVPYLNIKGSSTVPVSIDKYNVYDFSIKYLRFLTINYHF